MRKDSGKIRARVLIPISITIILLISLSIGGVYWIQSRSNQDNFQSDQEGVNQLFEVLLDEQADLLDSQIHFLQQDESLQTAFLAADRETLLAQATPAFEDMRENFRVTHFYFIDTDQVAFLRVHNPTRHDDTINRFTLINSRNSGKSDYGIELGSFGTFTLRYVQPWIINNELVGYMELGMEIEHITPRLKTILGNDVIFVVDKDYLNQESWEEGLNFLGREGDWNAFSDSVIIDQTISLTNERLTEFVTVSPQENYFDISFDDNQFQGGTVPLKDAGGRTVGQIFVLDEISSERAALQNVILVLVGIGIVLGGLLLASFYTFTGRVENILAREQDLLISDVRAQEQKLLEGVMHNAGSAIYVKDTADQILLANQKYLSLVDKQDIKGKPFAEVENPAFIAEINAIDQRILKSGNEEHREFSIEKNDILEHYIDFRFPILDPDGQIYATCSIATDITDRKEAEQVREKLIKDLQIANRLAKENTRLKSEFLATMSHELRTPMNAIEGFTSIMLSGMGGVEYNAKVDRYLNKINSNSKRLLKLINDFLDLSRIESGRLELAHMLMSPADMAQEWYNEISVLADAKKIDLQLDIDPNLPPSIYGDEESVSKIVINLLGNAIKFTEEGSVKLGVKVGETGDWIIEVTDTGIGIPPHAREYIFDEFRQVDQTSKRKYGGTGLGLAIVQRMTRAMDGSIILNSELGLGSTFIVTLPMHLVPEAV